VVVAADVEPLPLAESRQERIDLGARREALVVSQPAENE